MHDAAGDGLRSWELIDARRYFHDRRWGWCVSGYWASGRLMKRLSFPLDFVQVVA